MVVGDLEHVAELVEDAGDPVERHRLARLEQRVEALALDVLHVDEGDIVVGEPARARGSGLRRRRAAEICGIASRQIEEAAELIGTGQRLLSTVLQGVYQSNQATAAPCQVNNLHLLRGMIGRPGAGSTR